MCERLNDLIAIELTRARKIAEQYGDSVLLCGWLRGKLAFTLSA